MTDRDIPFASNVRVPDRSAQSRSGEVAGGTTSFSREAPGHARRGMQATATPPWRSPFCTVPTCWPVAPARDRDRSRHQATGMLAGGKKVYEPAPDSVIKV